MEFIMKKRVVVAMSGGVDSSVAALLLKREGYDVIGVTMQIWPQNDDLTGTCCGISAVHDAQRVSYKIDIPHYVMNFQDEFEAKVIRYFCNEYRVGRTPNPCIACNRYIKFESLLNKAISLEADYIATGHYARVEKSDTDGIFSLRTGVDEVKDQTYALYQLTQYQLQHTLFPLGNYHKTEVRQIAHQAELNVADRPESQEICFVSSGHYSDFVAEYLGPIKTAGSFRHVNGEWLGSHKGIHCYTVGQRKNLGLKCTHFTPLYVTKIDPETGTVWIGEEKDLYSTALLAKDATCISGVPLSGSRSVQVKIRYNSPRVPATATSLDGGGLRVDFAQPQKAVTPGQAVVLYNGDQVLGGGTIENGIN
jgi:tRNA-specific 2-thiouridylase